jgi:uncharacterized lipoprotein YmbA
MTRHLAWAVAMAFLLASCGSTPTHVFDLSTAADPEPVASPAAGPLIWVDKPAVAAYFDRIQTVTRSGGNRISMHEFEVWSDPPADLIASAIVDDLALRFGKDRVMRTPVSRHATPDWQLELDVTRFDVDDAGPREADRRCDRRAAPRGGKYMPWTGKGSRQGSLSAKGVTG